MQNHLSCVEEWRPAVKWEGLYSISSCGRVRQEAKRKGTYPGRMLHPSPQKKGYLAVLLSDRGVVIKTEKVANLVAYAFVGPRPEGRQINHKNGDKTDNHPQNLEYVTNRENIIHAYSLNLINTAKGERQGSSKLTTDEALAILNSNESTSLLAQRYGVSRQGIWRIRKRLSWRHLQQSQ